MSSRRDALGTIAVTLVCPAGPAVPAPPAATVVTLEPLASPVTPVGVRMTPLIPTELNVERVAWSVSPSTGKASSVINVEVAPGYGGVTPSTREATARPR